MSKINKVLKQAQLVQMKMSTLQKDLESRVLEVSSGRGAIKVKVSGKQELVSIKIDKEYVDPNKIEVLEELILTAVNSGLRKSSKTVVDAMNHLTRNSKESGEF